MAEGNHPRMEANHWLIDEMRQRYLDSPQSVDPSWQGYFQAEASQTKAEVPTAKPSDPTSVSTGPQSVQVPDHQPTDVSDQSSPPITTDLSQTGNGELTPPVQPSVSTTAAVITAPPTANSPEQPAAITATLTRPAESRADPIGSHEEKMEELVPLRGMARAIAKRMDQSLKVPTATSVRTVPTRLLEVNRLILNNQLKRRLIDNSVSFTHLIAWALVQGLKAHPEMNVSYQVIDGVTHLVQHPSINLGIAVDVQNEDGSRGLLVPNLKSVEQMDFGQFWEAYSELLYRTRIGLLTPDEMANTTVTITNPGTIGTVSSVPRLMPDQGLIIGLGAINYPPEYQASDEQFLARQGIGRVMTITSTYDHRVIQGAQSGELLGHVHRLLLGEEDFFDQIFESMQIPYTPARWAMDDNPPMGSREWVEKQAKVFQIIHAYRIRGHLISDLDPLRQHPPDLHPELDPLQYGLTIWDLDREFASGGVGGAEVLPLGSILSTLRNVYCRTTGTEYMHIQDTEQLAWFQERLEADNNELTDAEKLRIFDRLNRAYAFERFLHAKYVGHKRFGLEGGESLIPLLDALADEAAEHGGEKILLGMTHRGRLNVMANFTNKPLLQIFREFDGDYDLSATGKSGDVKYHLGYRGLYQTANNHQLEVSVAANPSHLEAINPVLEGLARATQDRLNVEEENQIGDPMATAKVVPVLMHGDAAIAGQGVVAETFNLSQLADYWTGGTIHIVVNNQVGFTTSPVETRSSHYATDGAKAIQAPIFHVNGDDPEAVVRAARLAVEYRTRFSHDVVIDLVCYRLRGHNEADEPSYTQPLMYRKIEQHVPVRDQYLQRLHRAKLIETSEADEVVEAYRQVLQEAYIGSGQHGELDPGTSPDGQPGGKGAGRRGDFPPVQGDFSSGEMVGDGWQEEMVWGEIDTTISGERAHSLLTNLTTLADGFVMHPKLSKQTETRAQSFENDAVDWATAELLAFASLAEEGIPIRLAGEDCRRGTFSQRHAEFINYDTGDPRAPIEEMDGAPVRIVDSLLSEFAAVGFEYGYSVGWPNALVLWEAQFGDFANGAQVIIDQFLSAGQVKWGQDSGLVLLLPHGQEGQGPEHSSARMERFLQLCAEENMRVAVPSTAGQYFHLLRNQALGMPRLPLVIFTPKSMLRASPAFASGEDITGRQFSPVLDDPLSPDHVDRVVISSGKVYFDLDQKRTEQELSNVALVRLELIYPFPTQEFEPIVEKYRDCQHVIWCQEEPKNMGAYRNVKGKLTEVFGKTVDYAGRDEAAAPAGGSFRRHRQQQESLVNQALGISD